MRRDDARDLHSRAGRLHRHLVGRAKTSGEQLKRRAISRDATRGPRLAILADRDLAKPLVDIKSDPPHSQLLLDK
jgi:hypothetical protein